MNLLLIQRIAMERVHVQLFRDYQYVRATMVTLEMSARRMCAQNKVFMILAPGYVRAPTAFLAMDARQCALLAALITPPH
jgi:hypothetical protein